MDLFDSARFFRALWKLPVWRLAASGLEATGHLLDLPHRVPEIAPGGARPLDAYMARGPAGELAAGAAAIDITPRNPEGFFLAGFGSARRCLALRDPLFARCLFLCDGQTPWLLIALDLIGLSLPRCARIRARISERFQHAVWLACTHSHESPDTLGLWGPALGGLLPYRTGLDDAYLSWLEERILECAGRAIAAARPARLHLASGLFDRAGKWIHNERSPVIDRSLRVMHLRDQQGAALATLVQHACHPETLWSDNQRMSADFCSVCCRSVERALGGVALYVNGALGAMVSAAVGHSTPVAQREALVDRLGQELGRAAIRLARRSLDAPCDQTHLSVAVEPVCFPAEHNALYRLVHALGVVEHRELAGGLRSEVCLARIGPATMLGLPGEPAPALGLELLERIDGEPRFLLGLCNDELGYLLPPEYFHDPAYAYEQTMTPGPLAATRLALAVERLAARLAVDPPDADG